MRVCFHLQVRTDRLDEYRAHHQHVWPEMLEALRSAGVRNYSLFLWEDGHEFGFLECDDWGAVQASLAASEVAHRWEALMANFLIHPVVPGRGPELLEELFHLD